MRTAEDVFHRLRWDEKYTACVCVIGYEDRFLGLQEKQLMEWQPGARDVKAEETFIPWHRVIYFKVNDRIVWDKSVDFDEVFFSGDANALKQIEVTTKTMKDWRVSVIEPYLSEFPPGIRRVYLAQLLNSLPFPSTLEEQQKLMQELPLLLTQFCEQAWNFINEDLESLSLTEQEQANFKALLYEEKTVDLESEMCQFLSLDTATQGKVLRSQPFFASDKKELSLNSNEQIELSGIEGSLIEDLWIFFRVRCPESLEKHGEVDHLILSPERERQIEGHFWKLYLILKEMFLGLLDLSRGVVVVICDQVVLINKCDKNFTTTVVEGQWGANLKNHLTQGANSRDEHCALLIEFSEPSPK